MTVRLYLYRFFSSDYTTSLGHQNQFSYLQKSWDVLGMTVVGKPNVYDLHDFEES